MTIAALRTIFKAESGRDDFSNDQCDGYINAGIELLDDMTAWIHAQAAQHVIVASGDRAISFSTRCRALSEIIIVDSAGNKTTLRKKTYDELQELMVDAEPGTPLYYSPGITRPEPVSFVKTDPAFSAYQNYIDTVASSWQAKGVLITPPTDQEYMAVMIGRFGSPVLSDTTTENWWSYNRSRAVIDAALLQYHSSLKNTEAMKDYLAKVQMATTAIDHDAAEDEAADITHMGE